MKFLALLFLFPSLCFAGDWMRDDTRWQLAYTAALAIDCAQTRYGAAHPDKFEEENPLLGKHPSIGKINNICLATGLGHWGISYLLPSGDKRGIGFRRAWQAGTTAIEAIVILENFDHGSKLKFHFLLPF
jgi:hypothetical protein